MAWNQLLYQMTLCRFTIAIAADAAAAAGTVAVAIASASCNKVCSKFNCIAILCHNETAALCLYVYAQAAEYS